MKKVLLISLLPLLFCTIVKAQTDDPGCNKLVIGTDIECSGAGCNTLVGCTSYSFHVDCGNTYKLKALVDCGNVNCGHCASCVSIYTNPPGVTPVASVNTLGTQYCESNVCDRTTTTTSISSGNYIMYVCLVACTQNDEETCCEELAGDCKAYGCLEWGTSGTGCP